MNEPTSPNQPVGDESAETSPAARAASLFRTVEQHPFEFIAGAFLLGLTAAFSIPRHDYHLRERFVDEPLEEIKDLLHEVAHSLRSHAAHALDAAECQTHGAAEKIKAAVRGRCS